MEIIPIPNTFDFYVAGVPAKTTVKWTYFFYLYNIVNDLTTPKFSLCLYLIKINIYIYIYNLMYN